MKVLLHQGAAPFLQRSILPRVGHRVFTFFWWPRHPLCFFSSDHLLWACTSTVCVYVCICVTVYVCMCVSVCQSVYMCIFVCVQAQVHVFVYAVYVHIHVCVYTCICKSMHMCMYVEAKCWYRVLFSIVLHLIYWDRSPLTIWSSLIWLDQWARKPCGYPCLYLLSTGIIIQLLARVLQIQTHTFMCVHQELCQLSHHSDPFSDILSQPHLASDARPSLRLPSWVLWILEERAGRHYSIWCQDSGSLLSFTIQRTPCP